MRVQHFALLMIGSVGSGCGAGDGGGGASSSSLGTCGIQAELSGGTTIRFTGKDDAACGTQHSFDTGIDVIYIGVDGKGSLELVIDEVTEGETGSDFPTRVAVQNMAKDRWQRDDCVSSLTEHRLVETEASAIGELRHYQVSGDGSCSEPLRPSPTDADGATLGPFAFRSQVTWRD